MKRLPTLALLFCLGISAEAQPATHGMVVSEQRVASQIGLDILRAGGNAIDAAVAVGYALAVVYPCCGNIGGGGFMTIHLANGQNIFLNFREKAPLKATPDMFLDAKGNVIADKTTTGYLAVGIPGTVLGLDTALKRYGTMPRKKVMAPAIKLAAEGYTVTAFDAKWFKEFADEFRSQPNIRAIFLKNNQPLQAGDKLIQTDLANTLTQLAEKGPDYFYRGPIAAEIVKASKAHGGIMSLNDFATYTVEELQPIRCTYRGYTVISAPPPSSGGITLCEMLMILEHFPLHATGFHTARSASYILESMRYAFADRNTKLGDPHFVNNPVQQLLSPAYTSAISERIKQTSFAPVTSMSIAPSELTDTTHFSIVDDKGNAVSVTYTLNGFFGAGVMADHTGFFLNNEMDDFATKPGSPNKFGLVQYEADAVQPAKRPLSSMTPTIVMQNDHVFMVLGSPGGPRIITSVLETILNIIDFDQTIQQAVDAPRFHFQGMPDEVDVEPFAFSFTTALALEYWGYNLSPQPTWGAVEAILIDPQTGTFEGANDARRPDGAALGY